MNLIYKIISLTLSFRTPPLTSYGFLGADTLVLYLGFASFSLNFGKVVFFLEFGAVDITINQKPNGNIK